MKKILLGLTIFSAVILYSCSGVGSGSPQDVLSEFFDALGKKDLEKASKLATKDSKSMIDMMGMAMKNDTGTVDEKYDKSKMEFGEAKIDGDMATVPVKEKSSNEVVNYKLKKEDGKWKVAFDKASLMSMGADTMKESGEDPEQKMQEGMQELDKIDMDSLKREMEKSMPDPTIQ